RSTCDAATRTAGASEPVWISPSIHASDSSCQPRPYDMDVFQALHRGRRTRSGGAGSRSRSPMNADSADPPQRASTSSDAGELVAALAARLTRSDSLEHPFIVGGRVGPAHARHVTVIWDRWAQVPGPERADLI